MRAHVDNAGVSEQACWAMSKICFNGAFASGAACVCLLARRWRTACRACRSVMLTLTRVGVCALSGVDGLSVVQPVCCFAALLACAPAPDHAFRRTHQSSGCCWLGCWVAVGADIIDCGFSVTRNEWIGLDDLCTTPIALILLILLMLCVCVCVCLCVSVCVSVCYVCLCL